MYVEIARSENSEIIPYKRESGRNLIVACPESFTIGSISAAIKRYYCCSTCGCDIQVLTRFRLRGSMSEALFTTETNIWNKTIDVFYPHVEGFLDFRWKCMECGMGAYWVENAMPKYREHEAVEDNEAVVITHEDLVAPPMSIREQLLHAKTFRYPVVVICRRDVPTSYGGIVLEVQDEQCVLEPEGGKRRFYPDIADIKKVVLSVYYDTAVTGPAEEGGDMNSC